MRRCAATLAKAFAAIAIATAMQGAFAQALDCARQPGSDRLKCEQAARIAVLCADFAGSARSACERHLVDTPALDDCARLDGYGRAKCETYNQGVLAEFPCAGKAGATLAMCAREHAQKLMAEK